MNCYDLTLELIRIMADIDRAVERKSKTSLPDEDMRLDAEITRLECRMFEIKNLLKKKEV